MACSWHLGYRHCRCGRSCLLGWRATSWLANVHRRARVCSFCWAYFLLGVGWLRPWDGCGNSCLAASLWRHCCLPSCTVLLPSSPVPSTNVRRPDTSRRPHHTPQTSQLAQPPMCWWSACASSHHSVVCRWLAWLSAWQIPDSPNSCDWLGRWVWRCGFFSSPGSGQNCGCAAGKLVGDHDAPC